MKKPKIREIREALRSLFSPPYTRNYPAKPHIPFPGYRGKPVPDDKYCIGCGACAEVCPSRAIEVVNNIASDPPSRVIKWRYDLCVFCGQCERLCTTEKGVVLDEDFDLTTYDRESLTAKVEKELVLCEMCGEIIAPQEQILWLIRKLGPLASGNFNLIYISQKELGIAEDISSGNLSEEMQRNSLYRVLCPKCRHSVIVFNQTGEQPK